MKKIINLTVKLTAIFFLIIAIHLIKKEIDKVGWISISNDILKTPIYIITISFLWVIIDFIALSEYDNLALKYLNKKIPYPHVLLASFLSFSMTNTTGHSYIAGGSIRYILYQKFLNKIQIFKMIAFESITYLLGMISLFILTMIMAEKSNILKNYTDLKGLYIGIYISFFLLFSYWFFFIRQKRKIFNITPPSLKTTIKQAILGATDISLISLCFYTLLNFHIQTNFLHVFIVFILAQIIGISSQVPGGIGVFESVFLTLYIHIPSEKSGILSALISFRVIYYFIPFFISIFFWILRMFYYKLTFKKTGV